MAETEKPEVERAPESADPDHDAGQRGDLSRSDLVTIRAAVNNGWNVSADVKQRLVERLQSIVQNPQTATRTLLSVARVLHGMTGQDLEREIADKAPATPAQQQQFSQPRQYTDEERRAIARAARLLDRPQQTECCDRPENPKAG